MGNVVCPNCGSTDCTFKIVTTNNLKRMGKILLSINPLLDKAGSYLLDKAGSSLLSEPDRKDDEYECNNCGRIFKLAETIVKEETENYDDEEVNDAIDDATKKKIIFKSINDYESRINDGDKNSSLFQSLSYQYLRLAQLEESQKNSYIARHYALGALDTEDTDDAERRTIVQNLFSKINKNILSEFNSDLSQCTEEGKALKLSHKFTSQTNKYIPFSDRQFIMFSKSDDKMAGYYDPDDNIKWVFSVNNYPNDIYIEDGPEPNVLYMANPVKTNTYLPYENAEQFLFQSKIREFEYLVGCLGATKIRFRSIKGKKVSSERDTDRTASAGVDVKAIKAEAKANWGKNETSKNSSSTEIGRDQDLTPTKYPYIPNDLSWYNNVGEWRDFARQRLQNGLTHYRYIFKSKECSKLGSQRKLDISASFKKLALKIKANYSQNIKETLETQEETEWEVEVEFKPLNEFEPQTVKSNFASIPQQSDNSLTKEEQSYLKCFKAVSSDGNITQNDRELLERRRIALNITKDKAKEIENMSSLSKEEQSYYNELMAVWSDGKIDNKERMVLDILKEDLGLTDEQVSKLEKMAQKL